MTIRVHPQGLGESLGSDLITEGPLVQTGKVWWVYSETGVDAVSPAGLAREQPLATIAQAVANAEDGDIIVLKDGHAETVAESSPLVIDKRVVIVGSGQSSGVPTCVVSVSGADTAVPIQITVAQVELRNIRFAARSVSSSKDKIEVGGSAHAFRMRDCYLQCAGNDDAFALRIQANYCEIRSTTFISTATLASAPANTALIFEGATSFYMEGCVFDGGSSGWSGGYAVDCDDSAPVIDVRCENITLLRGSDVRLVETSTGYFLASSGSQAPRIDWDGAEALA